MTRFYCEKWELNDKRYKKVKEKTIKEIYDFLRFHVKGQDDHLKKLAIVGYTQILKKNGYIKSKHKLNTLLLGGSGTGKTYILRILSEYLNLPYVIIPLTTVTEEGYDGSNIKTFLKELKTSENGEYGIVFFDELDKLGEHFNNMHKRSYLLGLQNELLTLIEGQKENNIIDTHNLLFFFGGAFSSILEKNKKAEIGFISNKTDNENKALKHELRKAGIRKELISRTQNIIKLNKLTKKDLKQIVVTENGYLDFYLEFFKAFNIEVTYSKDFIEIIVDNVDKDITYGVREINDILFKFLSPFMEKASMLETNKFYHLHLTKNVVTKKILKIKEVSIVD